MKSCACEKYKKNITFLDGVFVSAWIHSSGYRGEFFNFCPWCGKEMIEETSDKEKTIKQSIIEDTR